MPHMEFSPLPVSRASFGTRNAIHQEWLIANMQTLRDNRGLATMIDQCPAPASYATPGDAYNAITNRSSKLKVAAKRMGITDFRSAVRTVDGSTQLWVMATNVSQSV